MPQKSVAVGAECKWDVKKLGVIKRLLHSIADRMIVILRFNDCDGDVWFVVKQLINFLSLTAFDAPTSNNDRPVCKIDFLTNLRHHIPFRVICACNSGSDELRSDVRFRKVFFVHEKGLCGSRVMSTKSLPGVFAK